MKKTGPSIKFTSPRSDQTPASGSVLSDITHTFPVQVGLVLHLQEGVQEIVVLALAGVPAALRQHAPVYLPEIVDAVLREEREPANVAN